MTGFFSKFIKKLKGQSQGRPESQASQPDSGPASSAPQSLSSPATPDTPQAPPKKSSTGTTMATVWKARPIFFSSTFKDMHTERDYLRDHAFPRLAERLRERCHYLDTIDLRQGVENAHLADEAEREMQVLRVCLDEIERSRPFLVALLGDRYGWIPPAERISAAARAAGLSDSVDVEGKSVTELEILYGVLENTDQARRSWFYFRTIDRASMPPVIAARFPEEEPSTDADAPAAKLQGLKDRIRQQLPDRVREYRLRWDAEQQALVGLDELDAQVEQDLWSDLDPETAAYLREAPFTWQEADARAVSDFVVERIRGSIERPAMTKPMLEHALAPSTPEINWGLVVTGESGSGKSSLFGVTLQALQQRSAVGEILLLSHAAGIFPLSGQVDRMLRRWIGDLAQFLKITDPIAAQEEANLAAASADQTRPIDAKIITSEEIETTFASLLGRAAVTIRVVIFIDALNQFEPTTRAQHLTWLPRLWPENARFLATTIPGTASAALKERPGCVELPVLPISHDEAQAIAETFYREHHHRDVNPRVLNALLEKKDGEHPAHSNPLWLALALQEMNLLEADDFERAEQDFAHLPGAQRMEALQLAEAAKIPDDVPGVYGELLDRAERLHGAAWVRDLTSLLALGRSGWRESDLQMLMPKVSDTTWDPLLFAGLHRTLGSHLVQRGAQAQWDFFHQTLKQTVQKRYLANESTPRRLHGLLIEHLESLLPADALRQSEMMVHLLGFGDHDRAADFLAEANESQWDDPNMKAALTEAVNVFLEAIQSAPDDAGRKEITTWLVSLLAGEESERSGRIANVFLFDVHDGLAVTGAQPTDQVRFDLLNAVYHTLQGLTAAYPSNTYYQRDLQVNQVKMGDALKIRGDLARALQIYQKSLQMAEQLVTTDPSNTIWQRDLAISQISIASAQLGQGYLAKALQNFKKSLEIFEMFIVANPSNAIWQSDLSRCQRGIGAVLLGQGNLAEALDAYQQSLRICDQLIASDPNNTRLQSDLSEIQTDMGGALETLGDMTGALQAYQQSLRVCERLVADDPSNATWQSNFSRCQNRVGQILRVQGNLTEALQAYQESLRVQKRLAAANPNNTHWQRDLLANRENIGDILLDQGDLAGALQIYQECLKMYERLLVGDPSNANLQRNRSVSLHKTGDILAARGDLVGALQIHEKSLEVREQLAVADPSNTDCQRDLAVSNTKIGEALQALGDLTRALQVYQESLQIFKKLVAIDPSNAIWQRDLSVSQHKIGEVLEAQGNLVEAFQAYQESLRVFERLAAANPSNTRWQRDISVSRHHKMGELLQAQGDLAGALQVYQESCRVFENLTGIDPSNTAWQGDLAASYLRTGEILQARGDLPRALQLYQDSLQIFKSLVSANPNNTGWQNNLSVSHSSIGNILLFQGDLQGALHSYQKTLQIREQITGADPSNSDTERNLFSTYIQIAVVKDNLQHDDATTYWRKAYDKLFAMQRRGNTLPADEQYRDFLKAKAGIS